MPKSFILSEVSRKRHLLYGTAIGVLFAIGATEKVYAACVAPGPNGTVDPTKPFRNWRLIEEEVRAGMLLTPGSS